MSIETIFRVRCGACGKYLAREGFVHPRAVRPHNAATFPDCTSAYNEAVRRGWTEYPLICPDCAADLKEKVQRVEVRPDRDTEEDGRRLPESGQGPE